MSAHEHERVHRAVDACPLSSPRVPCLRTAHATPARRAAPGALGQSPACCATPRRRSARRAPASRPAAA
jgi:hypothetical protein